MTPDYFKNTCALIRSNPPREILEMIYMQASNTGSYLPLVFKRAVNVEDKLYPQKKTRSGYALHDKLNPEQIRWIKDNIHVHTIHEMSVIFECSETTFKTCLAYLKQQDPEFRTKRKKAFALQSL